MTISIDELSCRAGEEEAAARKRIDERIEALRDPFKHKRSEPGRALPHHGNQSAYYIPSTSLGGKHS